MNRNQANRAVLTLALMVAFSPVAFSAGASAHSAAAPQAESTYAEEATQISVELSKGLDSRSNKPGQEVTGKLVAEARLADGTTLPKGSKLVGHVTAVQPSGHDNPNGQITVLFDHVVARDGHPIPVHALLLGIRIPPRATPPPMSGSDVTGMGRGGMATPGMAGAGANGPAASGPGMDGPRMNGGASNGPPNGATETGPGGTSGSGPVNMPPAAAAGASPTGAAVGPAGAVGGLPGVTWGNVAVEANGATAATPPPPGAPTAVLFNGQGRNVTLDGGAQMVLAVTPQQATPQPSAPQ